MVVPVQSIHKIEQSDQDMDRKMLRFVSCNWSNNGEY